MLFEDALKAMRKGEKVKPFNWPGDKYIYLKDGCIYSSKEILQKEICCEYFFTDWKIYEKPAKEESVKTENLTFGEALEFVKKHKKISRKCWRNPDINIYLHFAFFPHEENYFRVKTVRGILAPWTPNAAELLAEDWFVVDETEESK